MNWPGIKEKYPKSWNLLIQFKAEDISLPKRLYLAYELPIKSLTSNDLNIRDLFDFFDYNDIWIEIETEKVGRWNYYIHNCYDDDEIFIIDSNDEQYYPTRKEAEEKAFIQSFVALEKKLKKS